MNAYVVDASVAVKWFLPEEHTEQCLRLRAQPGELHAPDFLWIEVASVVCQRIYRGELPAEQGRRIVTTLRAVPMQIVPAADLLEEATSLALEASASVYDCLYLALAVRIGGQMVTADRRLFRKLTPVRFAKRVLWAGAIP